MIYSIIGIPIETNESPGSSGIDTGAKKTGDGLINRIRIGKVL